MTALQSLRMAAHTIGAMVVATEAADAMAKLRMTASLEDEDVSRLEVALAQTYWALKSIR